MPTTVVSSIGTTGRDYSTLQAWEDACPANLVTADQVWKGECYNDSEFTAKVVISGQTTDATRYVWLTAAAGQSFQDHASARTNPLVYDQSKGVGIRGGPDHLVQIYADYTRVERLQIKLTSATYGSRSPIWFNTSAHAVLADCLCEATAGQVAPRGSSPGDWIAKNCLFLANYSGGDVVAGGYKGIFINCTIARSTAYSSAGYINGGYGLKFTNCAIFGVLGFAGSFDSASSYNATDLASGLPGSTGNQHSVTFANCFESTTNDFRLKAGSPLIDAGNTDATNAPNDITGTARDATTDGDIGAWEYTAGGGGGGTDMPEHLLRMRRPGVTWSNNTGA